jgi:hypothetical protein
MDDTGQSECHISRLVAMYFGAGRTRVAITKPFPMAVSPRLCISIDLRCLGSFAALINPQFWQSWQSPSSGNSVCACTMIMPSFCAIMPNRNSTQASVVGSCMSGISRDEARAAQPDEPYRKALQAAWKKPFLRKPHPPPTPTLRTKN